MNFHFFVDELFERRAIVILKFRGTERPGFLVDELYRKIDHVFLRLLRRHLIEVLRRLAQLIGVA